jgi:hypothetical protein
MKRTTHLMVVAAAVVAGTALAMFAVLPSVEVKEQAGSSGLATALQAACVGCDSGSAMPLQVRKDFDRLQARGQASAQQGGQPAVHADFNGDARSDLVLDHLLSRWFAYWEMSGFTPTAYSPVFAPPPSYRRVATTDFTGDGKADVMWHRSGLDLILWATDGTGGFVQATVPTPSPFFEVIAAEDVDGDGKGDLLISTDSGRSVAYLLMDGAVIRRRSPELASPTGYRPVAFGDFNGDGRADIVWKSGRTLLMWLGDGAGFTPAPIRDHAEGWDVWGAGDVDGDGKADLLLTHRAFRLLAYWIMDGAAVLRYSPAFRLPGGETPNARFGPITTGDYNGDGRLDIVHSRERDESLVMWVGDGNGFREWPMRQHALGWRVAPRYGRDGAPVRPYVAGDTNGDGRADLVINNVDRNRNPATWSGFSKYYLFDGIGWQLDRQAGITGGQPLATGDFDADGRLDLVMDRDDPGGTRQTLIALSSRYESAVEHALIPTPAPTWQIIGADDVDGDGRSDILLGQGVADALVGGEQYRNPSMQGFAFWVMGEAGVARYSIGFHTDPATPRLAAKGDFNGDGRVDLVWSSLPDAADPQLRMWLGDGNGFSVLAFSAPAQGWNVVAGGDVDGDGLTDLILKNAEGMAYWLMDSARIRGYSPGFLLPDNQHVADINGDGRSDILRLETFFRSNFNVSTVILHYSNGNGFVPVPTAGGVGHTNFDAVGSMPARIFTR